LALEELGPTFIKLGQLLSTRPDLLPAQYLSEFARLQDDAASFPAEIVLQRIEAELGRPIESLFAEFDSQPLAAASIGQAHRAVLPDAREVVIKVRRPGAVEQVEVDLEILANLAAAASRRWEVAERYDVVGLVQEFAQTLRAELDYLQEAQNAGRFAVNFAGDPNVHIPRICWELTTSRVLTLERIRGTKISDLTEIAAQGIDRSALARSGTAVIVKMIFEDGFFHADLHPGNFFIEADGRFGLIDFGMVGVLDDATRDRLAELLVALINQQYARLAEALLDLGVTKRHVDRRALRGDLEGLISPNYGRPLSELQLAPILTQVFAIMRRHHLHLPPNLALLVKTILIADGIGLRLDPAFRLTTVIAPYANRLMMRQLSPKLMVKRLGKVGLDVARFGAEVPEQLRQILSDIERDGFEFSLRGGSFEPLIERLERLANRIVLGILTAAFIVGLAALLTVYHPSGWERWAGVMLTIGFVLAIVIGVYLAITILGSTCAKRKV
jgi:ubiquinone biosynthesis protein